MLYTQVFYHIWTVEMPLSHTNASLIVCSFTVFLFLKIQKLCWSLSLAFGANVGSTGSNLAQNISKTSSFSFLSCSLLTILPINLENAKLIVQYVFMFLCFCFFSDAATVRLWSEWEKQTQVYGTVSSGPTWHDWHWGSGEYWSLPPAFSRFILVHLFWLHMLLFSSTVKTVYVWY